MGGVAVAADSGLRDAAAVDLHTRGEGTHLAAEEGLLHFWDQLGCADHHATDGNELVNVCSGRGAGRGGGREREGESTINMQSVCQ